MELRDPDAEARLSLAASSRPGPEQAEHGEQRHPVGADQVVGIAELVAPAVARREHEVDERQRADAGRGHDQQAPHADAGAERKDHKRPEHRPGAKREQEAAGEAHGEGGGKGVAPGKADQGV